MQFDVQNMTCSHCARAITAALQRLDPQAQVEVDLALAQVRTQGRFSAEQAIAAMTGEGYPAKQKSDKAAACCSRG